MGAFAPNKNSVKYLKTSLHKQYTIGRQKKYHLYAI